MATTPFLSRRASALPAQTYGATVLERPRRVRTTIAGESFAVASYLGSLHAENDPRARLQRGVELLPTLVAGCDHASVTTVAGGRSEVRAASDSTARRADQLQDELEEGPRLQAVRTGHSVVARDLSAETRWTGWCSAAVGELGVRSVLSVLLTATTNPVATLNLYSNAVDGVSLVDLARLHTLSGPLADALLGDGHGVNQPAA
jgi:hypothetical protein